MEHLIQFGSDIVAKADFLSFIFLNSNFSYTFPTFYLFSRI